MLSLLMVQQSYTESSTTEVRALSHPPPLTKQLYPRRKSTLPRNKSESPAQYGAASTRSAL